MQKVSVMVPPLRTAPPGAVWLANAVSWLFDGGARVRSRFPAWLEAVRARIEAGRAARTEARSRVELLALAARYQSSQPEFAKDLFAAANNDRD
jgi:hypothetical protein